MNEIAFRSPKNVLIDTVGRWRELAPREWGRGRPLTELAGRWLTSDVPEVDALLESKQVTSGFVAEEGRVRLPDLDLIVVGRAAGGRTVVAALPLADDPLGPTVDESLQQLVRGRYAGVPRAEQMSRSVFGVPSSAIGALRLRLLSVTWALLAEATARDCVQAVLVLHELRSHLSPGQVVATHAADVDAYLRRLSLDDVSAAQPGILAGPLPHAGTTALFLGKVVVTS